MLVANIERQKWYIPVLYDRLY